MMSIALAAGVVLIPRYGLANCGPAYVLVPRANLRAGPGPDHDLIDSVDQNVSLDCLANRDGWMQVAIVGGQTGWIRADLVSQTVIRIHKNEQTLLVTHSGNVVLTLPVAPGAKGLGAGRYFASPEGKQLALSWPNRHDLRAYLLAGAITYPAYSKAVVHGAESMGGNGLAICPGPTGGDSCGALLSPGDFGRLLAEVPGGARLEIYANHDEDRDINRPDELSRRIHMGAVAQLSRPAAGLSPGGRPPNLAYPGGDIQPDFATSTDIVIRAVRRAGIDLQALVHEDMLRHPTRYVGLDMGEEGSGSHRLVPVLSAFLAQNALSLPTDVHADPFGFEAGDIVVFATGVAGDGVPDRVGLVGDTFNRAGYPLIITVWDMGQSTNRMDLLGRESLKVVGHFRMTHLYDYQ